MAAIINQMARSNHAEHLPGARAIRRSTEYTPATLA
jgi:hypothetical protein